MSKKHEDQEPIEVEQLSVLERLQEEEAGLAFRIDALVGFIAGSGFHALEKIEQDRLTGQRTAMKHYHEILCARIEYHQAKEQG